MLKKLLLLGTICTFFSSAYAGEVFVNKNINSFFKETSTRTANATCFMYPKNQFKCACRFSDNSKLWASAPMSEIQGMTIETKHGVIEACSNAKK